MPLSKTHLHDYEAFALVNFARVNTLPLTLGMQDGLLFFDTASLPWAAQMVLGMREALKMAHQELSK